MVDLRRLRDDLERTRAALSSKGCTVDVERILALDARVREATAQVERLRAQRNALAQHLASRGAPGEPPEELRRQARELSASIKTSEEVLRQDREELERLLLWVPNIPHESVPRGRGPDDNVVVRTWGELPSFSFPPAPHWDLGATLGILDQVRAARIAGSHFVLFEGQGALLVRALISLMLDIHTREHGYTEFWVPSLATRESMVGTGQLPKLEEDMYVCRDPELFLIPTGEVPLTNLWRDQIIPEEQLPIRAVGYTPCFRREAGAYGRETRGLNRVHQFDKVELVKLVEPSRSYEELEALVADAEEILQRLEIPYRVVSLCTAELGFAAAKCYDLEVWSPGQGKWLEVSSCSNFEDFQARRMGIRYRPKGGGKPRFVHTLNGSGLAIPRLVAALVECGQTERGTVRVPEALVPYVHGLRELAPRPVAASEI